MADTWQLELWQTLATIASAYEDANPSQQAQLKTQLRPAMARIDGTYPQAKTSDPDLRYVILDDCAEIRDILAATLGPDWRPTPGTLGAKLSAAGIPITT